jgi:hypothetical protein
MNMKKSPKHLLMLMELPLMNTALPQKLPLKNMLLKDVEDEEDSVAAATVTADPQPGPLRETTATAPVVVLKTPLLAVPHNLPAVLLPVVPLPVAQLPVVPLLPVAKLPDKDVPSLSILRSQSHTEDQGGIAWPPNSFVNRP